MPTFRLTQITDTHLSPRYPEFTENFRRVCQHIIDHPPDLVINSGDVSFDGQTQAADLEFAKTEHGGLRVKCRFIPGNHDIGDNPTQSDPRPKQLVSEHDRQSFISVFGGDRWQFDAAGWRFIGLNTLIMNSGHDCEGEQFEWLAEHLSEANGMPIALFTHKPLFRNAPDDPEEAATSFRYVPMPARKHLVAMLDTANVRLVACGHVHQRRDFTFRNTRHIWAPSASFVIASEQRQTTIGVKETGLVEYAFQPDGFEVRHVRAFGQSDIDLFSVYEPAAQS
jgi:3',5'-cyclic AMP phosphodiesterase CpdA